MPHVPTALLDVAAVPEDDPVLAALEDLVAALEANASRIKRIVDRASAIRTLREAGLSYSEIVQPDDRPLIVELITANIEALMAAGGAVRRAEARALHDEGIPMDRIAELFGVTRQRVSALLRQPGAVADEAGSN
jgi:DNA repair photolyase